MYSDKFTVGMMINLCVKAIKYVADTLTGKNLPGRFFHWAFRTLWRGAQSIPSMRNFEGWRQTRSGLLGWLVNPVDSCRRAQTMCDRNIAESRISAILSTATRQPVGSEQRRGSQREAERLIREITKSDRAEDIDAATELIRVIQSPGETRAIRAIALYNLRRVGNSNHFADQRVAASWLSNHGNAAYVTSIGLDPGRYIR